ncbi:hypothetical protein GDO86_016650 [Hymenochirus boettgeri]|uniref:Ig-like domain-containing protein n=1 Tax=Hymenochirus boettgeri TaxID=247094 RepID=A0A8T2K1W9_9PIPI|nr:hypothetical protein GDO86_016650 [Hymenochirus boettgeri]
MDCNWGVLLLFAQAGVLSAKHIYQVQGIIGGKIHLAPQIPRGFTTRDVFWKHMSHTEELVASFTRGSTETKYRSRFFGRINLLKNFTLEVTSLEMGDSGTFSSLLVDYGGSMQQIQFHLTVYEVVAKPVVQVFSSSSGEESDNCTVFLSCVTASGSDITYRWAANSEMGGSVSLNDSIYDGGRIAKVYLSPLDLHLSYTCTVSNLVSQEDTSVVPWNNCKLDTGKDSGVFGCKIIPYLAVTLILLFIAMTFWVLLCTKSQDVPPVLLQL